MESESKKADESQEIKQEEPEVAQYSAPALSKPPSPHPSEASSEAGSSTGKQPKGSAPPTPQSEAAKRLPLRTGFTWEEGARIEAMDINKKWYNAKIVAVDAEDKTVLIHFEGWNQRYDEWLSMNSERIRPATRHSERKEKLKARKLDKEKPTEHKIGDCVFARWTDCRLYPAKVLRIHPNGSFEVLFYDGFTKIIQPINVKHMPEELQKEYTTVLNQVLSSSPTARSTLKKARQEASKIQPLSEKASADGKGESKPRERHKERRGSERRASFEKSSQRKRVTGGSVQSRRSTTDESKVEVKIEPGETTEKTATASSKEEDSFPKIDKSKIAAPKAFKVESDHNQFKCPLDFCNKGFRKETLLEYHIKYYHTEDGSPVQPPPPKKRKKTISVCSTDSDISVGGTVPKHIGGSKSKRRDRSASAVSTTSTITSEQEEVTRDTATTGTRSLSMDDTHTVDFDDNQTTTTATDDTDRQDQMEDDLDTTEEMDNLAKDEVVNCICQINEENGLMIQCDICLCWQHALCLEITEETLPNKYVCDICQNPPAVREGAQYLWNQDWWREGTLACFRFLPNCDTDRQSPNIKATQELLGDVMNIGTILKGVKQQLHLYHNKAHPEVHRWTKDWDTVATASTDPEPNPEEPTPEAGPSNQDDDNMSGRSTPLMEVYSSDEQHSPEAKDGTADDETKPNAPPAKVDKESPDTNTSKEQNVSLSSTPALQTSASLSTAPAPVSKENAASSSSSAPAPAPAQEKPTSQDQLKTCQQNLLQHVNCTHDDVTAQLDMIEEQVAALEGHADPQNILSDIPQLKKSLHMLLRDLTKVKHMSMYH